MICLSMVYIPMTVHISSCLSNFSGDCNAWNVVCDGYMYARNVLV